MACAALEKDSHSECLWHMLAYPLRDQEGDWIDLKYSFGDTLALGFAGKLMGFSGLSAPSKEADHVMRERGRERERVCVCVCQSYGVGA